MVLILALSGSAALVYRNYKSAQESVPVSRPASLPKNVVMATDGGWTYRSDDNGRPVVEVRAKEFAQQTDPPRVQLKQLELKLFHKDGQKFDLVKSPSGELKLDENLLYADGQVEITLGLEALPPEQKSNRLLTILTSGASFDTQLGKAWTDREASFVFEHSKGQALGAAYDPNAKELHLKQNVVLEWNGDGTKPTMRVEAGELLYRENEAKVFLKPWSKLMRESLQLQAGEATITLEGDEIRKVETVKAEGTDVQPKRKLTYGADNLFIDFGPKMVITRLQGNGNARLDNEAATGLTKVRSQTMDLTFLPAGSESHLERAIANGQTVVESFPKAKDTKNPPLDRVLRSETVELTMRPGGEEVEKMVTHTPGTLEFLPKLKEQRYRKVKAERMWVTYAAGNQLESYRAAAKVETVTRPPEKGEAAKEAEMRTYSDDLLAKFTVATGELETLEQWGKFRYQQGDQQARSQSARLRQGDGKIQLEQQARYADAAGTTEADQIELDQKTGDVVAQGHVASTRLPDRKDQQRSGTLSDSGETMQAKADRMTTKDRNKWIRYEGSATLWQGANRIQGEIITIQRDKQQLQASGNVQSQFRDKAKGQYTLVKAPEMEYDDREKLAVYTGGVQLNREAMVVTSQRLRAWFVKEEQAKAQEGKPIDARTSEAKTDAAGTLQHAIAEGNVVILQAGKDAEGRDRTRRGQSEHADYWVPEERVILTGGSPQFFDSLKGLTKGTQITWYSGLDRFQVEGAGTTPAVSRILKKSGKSTK